MQIFKVFRASEWAQLQQDGQTLGAPVDLADGYVHFSTAGQLPTTLGRHFAAERDLTLVTCEAEALGPALLWEPSRGGALFPHLHRALRLEDVLAHRPVAEADRVESRVGGRVEGPRTDNRTDGPNGESA